MSAMVLVLGLLLGCLLFPASPDETAMKPMTVR
jgi:hypothetical protein